MNVIFVSNYLSEHQIEFCKTLNATDGVTFHFLQTEKFSEERKKLGWKNYSSEFSFFVDVQSENSEVVENLVTSADVIIYGGRVMNIYKYNLKKDVLVLYYSERLFKKSNKIGFLRYLKLAYYYRFENRKYNKAVLCASAYASADYLRIRAFKNKAFKWGYFPPKKVYDISELFKLKGGDIVKILWVGRIIDWKRTIDVLELAKKLKQAKRRFVLKIIGTGNLENQIEKTVDDYNLSDCVVIMGALNQTQVRKQMEEADIFLATSDYNEGWGAVINEAMNSGCAVIASHAMGSVPFLIKDGENGLIYPCGDIDEMFRCAVKCIDDREFMQKLGVNAYETITKRWNAENAVSQLMLLIRNLKGEKSVYPKEICEQAMPLQNEWIYELKGK